MIILDKNNVKMGINPRHYVKATATKVGGCIIQLFIDGMEGSIQSSQSVEEIDAIMSCCTPNVVAIDSPVLELNQVVKNKGGRPRKNG